MHSVARELAYPDWINEPDSANFIGVIGYGEHLIEDNCKTEANRRLEVKLSKESAVNKMKCRQIPVKAQALVAARHELLMRYGYTIFATGEYRKTNCNTKGCDMDVYNSKVQVLAQSCGLELALSEKESWRHPISNELFIWYVIEKDALFNQLSQLQAKLKDGRCI